MNDTELPRAIIGAAIEVHKQLGPGLLESAYEACLCHEVAIRGIHFEKERPTALIYKQIKPDCGLRLDLLVLKDGVRRFIMPRLQESIS